VHTRLGSFLPPAPTPSLTTHSAPYHFFSFLSFFLFLVVLGVELMASCLHELLCQTFLCDYFWDRFSHYAPAGLHYKPSICASPHSRDDRCTPPHPAIGWDGVWHTFCLGWLRTMILPIFTSQVARIIGLSHYTQVLYTISLKIS
jgi:hypothetical protein